MDYKRVFWFIGLLVVLILIAVLFGVFNERSDNSYSEIDSFEECVEAGYPVMESFPDRCMTPDGKSFIKEYPEEVLDDINPQDSEIGNREERYPGAYDGCVITGCSGQICAGEEVASTCEWLEAYACYQDFGVCEEQRVGECGWSDTEPLNSCLSQFE